MNCKSIFYLLALTVVTFSSCEKNADTKGDTGEQGIAGAPGANGSAILSGTGIPATTLGKDGDYYIDKTTSIFYGPKAGSAWNTSVSLKGQTGANGSNGTNGSNGANGADGTNGSNGANGSNGTNGSTILNGTNAPDLSLGNIGDFYINTATADFYGPKTAGTWGRSISLRGPQGDSGSGNNFNISFYRFQGFPEVIIVPGVNPGLFQWNCKLRLTPANYILDNDYGLVLVYLRNITDPQSSWSSYIDEPGFVINSSNKNDHILIKGEFDSADPNHFIFVMGYRFDVKVVTIPASLTKSMSANHIDTKNIKAVENFLNLNIK
ncbi:collagen-like protein [Pedobacter gandavensis]|uniref:Collagen-like protein n=1 Tax=Pedobacter gandavensis TaxID=2679963 RepID=A0ABR6F106_9SPHI|nr:collagen-like protein [Pedobacter gandavensis]MBB2151206.1 hypothetical protein [Pedobacter gandavensis]